MAVGMGANLWESDLLVDEEILSAHDKIWKWFRGGSGVKHNLHMDRITSAVPKVKVREAILMHWVMVGGLCWSLFVDRVSGFNDGGLVPTYSLYLIILIVFIW